MAMEYKCLIKDIMMDIGKMIKLMALQLLNILTEMFTMGNGRMTSQMGLEFVLISMDPLMKVKLQMERKMEKENKNGQMGQNLSERSKMAKFMVMGHINGLERVNILVSGKMM